MGLRGPAPKPSVIEIQEGLPGHRNPNRFEPRPRAGRPKMPENVRADPAAAKEWRRLVPLLERMRVLSEADGMALGLLCIDYAQLCQVQDSIRKSGMLIRNPKTDHIHANPLLLIQAHLAHRAVQHFREFGLTPSARSRIIAGQSAASDLEDFIA